MRHRKSGRKFGRNSAHRRAMFRNMVTSLLRHGGIRTTVAKAKELRRFAEPTITQSVRVQAIVEKPVEARSPEERVRLVHAMRMAGRYVNDRDVLRRLFYEVGPLMKGRPGGYTRIVKLGPREGDGAPMARIELVAQPKGAQEEGGAETTAAS